MNDPNVKLMKVEGDNVVSGVTIHTCDEHPVNFADDAPAGETALDTEPLVTTPDLPEEWLKEDNQFVPVESASVADSNESPAEIVDTKKAEKKAKK